MGRFIGLLSTAIVLFVGVVTLLGLLIGDDFGFATFFLVDLFQSRLFTRFFLNITVITLALTIIIGILNLFGVHLRRIVTRQRGWFNSVVLLLSALLVFAVTLAERYNLISAPPGQPTVSMILLDSVQISLEATLGALLFFALVFGAYRLMRRQVTWGGLLFILSLLIVLLGSLPLPGGGLSLLASAREWWLAVPVSAGTRGILLGIALATLVAGLRILIGQDRSYRE